MKDAIHYLQTAANLIAERGIERDKAEGERSMASTVTAFNAVTGHTLSETQGWMFMQILKMARSQGGEYRADDYEDGVSYSALAAESANKEYA